MSSKHPKYGPLIKLFEILIIKILTMKITHNLNLPWYLTLTYAVNPF